MVEELVLDGLLVVSLAFAVALILVSAATVGRKLADLEYQSASGIDGVRRIQSVINVRTHINRVFLGAVFVVITMLLLADAPMIWRTWTNRVLFMLLLGSYAITSYVDWLDERKQLRINTAQEVASHAQSFAAGVQDAETRAARSPESVDVATIQPKAVADIAEAVRPPPTSKEI